MKKLILAGLVALGTVGVVATTTATEVPKACQTVRCTACPEGTHWDPRPNDCCRCVPD
jgi:hypothetical protein